MDCVWYNDCIHVRLVYVRLGLVPGRHPKINLFGLHYCVICCEVETKFILSDICRIHFHRRSNGGIMAGNRNLVNQSES